jgi:hypothetical protein
MVYGTLYAGVDYDSPYLIVNSVVSYPPPLQRGRGGVGKISPIGWAHLYLSANFKNNKYICKGRGSKEGRGESWPYVFEYCSHFMEHLQPRGWADLKPNVVASFNSHKIIMNLGSVHAKV